MGSVLIVEVKRTVSDMLKDELLIEQCKIESNLQ